MSKSIDVMKEEYLDYLKNHIKNVENAWEWIKLNFDLDSSYTTLMDKLIQCHDSSKYDYDDEFYDYMVYFYSGEKNQEIKDNFNKAWLHHIHQNPHHWQHWVLYEDEGNVICIDMPIESIYEMICDWWSFSWADNNLFEVFDWYEKHKDRQLMSTNTRLIVESILNKMKEKLEQDE